MLFLEYPYYIGYRAKYKWARRWQKKLPKKVISIGNLTVGGTGKTPAVIALCKEAINRGFKPCVLLRGYKGSLNKPVFVSKGRGALYNAKEAGDEAVMISLKVPGAFVIKAANRYEGGLLAQDVADLFILDDGFQHWKLHRDIDIVLIDGTRGIANGRLLPFGPLREPIEAITRAHFLVYTKKMEKDLESTLNLPNTLTQNVYTSTHSPSHLINQKGELFSLDTIKNTSVYAFCAIGNPESFKDTLAGLGANTIELKTFRDHYFYKPKDGIYIFEKAKRLGCKYLITTEKDMVKLTGLNIKAPNILALAIEFNISSSFYDKIFAALD